MSVVISVVVGVGREEYVGGAVVDGRVAVRPAPGTGMVVNDGFVVGDAVTTVGGGVDVGPAVGAVVAGVAGSAGCLSPSPWLAAYAMPRPASRSAATATAARTGVSCGMDVLRVGLPVRGSLGTARMSRWADPRRGLRSLASFEMASPGAEAPISEEP
jgi:hypothetical protein